MPMPMKKKEESAVYLNATTLTAKELGESVSPLTKALLGLDETYEEVQHE